jgi:hypothetical protein
MLSPSPSSPPPGSSSFVSSDESLNSSSSPPSLGLSDKSPSYFLLVDFSSHGSGSGSGSQTISGQISPI